jgi:hypothetical protein
LKGAYLLFDFAAFAFRTLEFSLLMFRYG